MESSGKKTESKRENNENYGKKGTKEIMEEGDLMKDKGEKMISDFMEKKRKRLLDSLKKEKDIKEKIINELIDFEKKNLIDSLKEKKEFILLKKKLKINSNEIEELLFN